MGAVEDVKPLSFFKQKSDTILNYIKSTKKPKFITVNGNVEFVVQDAQSYQDMVEYVDSINSTYVVAKVKKAMKEIEEGKGIPVDELLSRIEKKYKFNL